MTTRLQDGLVIYGDALQTLCAIPERTVSLVYIDPPFNTGEQQHMKRTRNFGEVVSEMTYADAWATSEEYIYWLRTIMLEVKRVLTNNGSVYVHIDWREVHYVKVMMDDIFGRANFLNEIIWAYDYGGRSKAKWPNKHDNILWYGKNVAGSGYIFNYDAIDRIPYMAPGLQTSERAAAGKTPTDTWWHTIVPTQGAERTGYPTQKPLGIVRRIVLASSNPDDIVLDCFAGSGTLGAAAIELSRRFILVDSNPQAIAVMRRRLGDRGKTQWITYNGESDNISPILLG